MRTDIEKETSIEVQRYINTAERLNHLDVTIPKIHYHYTSVESALSILTSSKFKLSHPDKFNDPYDLDMSLIDFNCDAESFLKYVKTNNYYFTEKDRPSGDLSRFSLTDKTITEFKAIFKQKRDQFGVGCFSGIYNNGLMWSHYAERHKGVCIGFDYQAFRPQCFIYPVKYVKKKITCNYFDTEIQPLFFLSFLKSSIWKYEKEVRIVHFNTEYLNNQLVPFNKNSVSRVYFGLKTSSEDKGRVLEVLKNQQYSKVKVFEMTSNTVDYGFLKPKKINQTIK